MVGRRGVVLAGILALAPVAHAGDGAPTAVVRRFNDTLLSIMKDGQSLGYAGRFKRLQPVMQETFDIPLMAEKVLGSQWKGLSEADQARWRELFAEFTVANYAANFDAFTGQQFEILGEEASANDTVLVKSVVKSPGHEDVELTYRLHQAGGGWRIMDVFLKGTVSELALRRSDYSSVLERDGFGGLATVLQSRIADLAAGRAKREQP
jgi:phospholipid transport system substrate-binding protein